MKLENMCLTTEQYSSSLTLWMTSHDPRKTGALEPLVSWWLCSLRLYSDLEYQEILAVLDSI